MKIARERGKALTVNGRSWQADGKLSARYWSEAVREKPDSAGLFYYWRGERPLDPKAPQLSGTGEIACESADRATGYFTTLVEGRPEATMRTSGVYLRAEPEEVATLDGSDDRQRAKLIASQLKRWKIIRSS